jgi:hypothetical protein
MEIISHRGFWLTPDEKNTKAAFDRTVADGFGTETDVRDLAGKLVVAHDPPKGGEIPWADVVAQFDGTGLSLAVNIKADGLAPMLKAVFEPTTIPWFAFDMSGPETIRYAKEGLPFYTRHSDIEPEPVLYGQADGVWLDAFHSEWFDANVVKRHLAAGKRVCIVSPELHGRDPRPVWDWLIDIAGEAGVTLCTDRPQDAKAEGL